MANTTFPGAGGGPLPLSDGLSMATHLPQLTTETELQKLLADERMRSTMHRTNYEQLKEEHRRYEETWTPMYMYAFPLYQWQSTIFER